MSQKGLRIAERTGLANSMSIIGKMNAVGFLDSTNVVTAGLNHPTELCKTICPNLIQVKPLDRLVARLNHPAELYG